VGRRVLVCGRAVDGREEYVELLRSPPIGRKYSREIFPPALIPAKGFDVDGVVNGRCSISEYFMSLPHCRD
jgi:hypothetical protein